MPTISCIVQRSAASLISLVHCSSLLQQLSHNGMVPKACCVQEAGGILPQLDTLLVPGQTRMPQSYMTGMRTISCLSAPARELTTGPAGWDCCLSVSGIQSGNSSVTVATY